MDKIELKSIIKECIFDIISENENNIRKVTPIERIDYEHNLPKPTVIKPLNKDDKGFADVFDKALHPNNNEDEKKENNTDNDTVLKIMASKSNKLQDELQN